MRERQRFRRARSDERLCEQQDEKRDGEGVAQMLCRAAAAEEQDAMSVIAAPLQPRAPAEGNDERREHSGERQEARDQAANSAGA